ncbi:MAG TPA: hypothetical protein VIM21_13635 [Gemmatimonadaceae bacterium]
METQLLRSFALPCRSFLLAPPTHAVGQADPSTLPANPERPLAREFGLGVSQYFGETKNDPQYSTAPSNNTRSHLAARNVHLFARSVHLLTYRQLIAIQGLQSMRRLEG